MSPASTSIFGIIFAIGLLGPTTVPKLIGSLSVGGTVQKSLPIAALLAIVLCGLSFLMGKAARRTPQRNAGCTQRELIANVK